MSPVILKRAGISDLGRVYSYVRRLADAENFPGELLPGEEEVRQKWFGAYRAEAVLAEIGGEPVGFAVCFTAVHVPEYPDALYMAAFFVEPSFRKRGVGRSFIKWLEERARSLGLARIVWCCQVDNRDALAFSDGIGAVACEDRQVYVDASHPYVLRFYLLPAHS